MRSWVWKGEVNYMGINLSKWLTSDCGFTIMHSKYYFFSLQFRVYLNIIYTIVEVMRCADPSESVELAQAQNAFFNELSM